MSTLVHELQRSTHITINSFKRYNLVQKWFGEDDDAIGLIACTRARMRAGAPTPASPAWTSAGTWPPAARVTHASSAHHLRVLAPPDGDMVLRWKAQSV